MDDGTYGHAYEYIGKYLFECRQHLLPGVFKPILPGEIRGLQIHVWGRENEVLHISVHVKLLNDGPACYRHYQPQHHIDNCHPCPEDTHQQH